MTTATDKLRAILARHAEWVGDPATGKHADLTGADLRYADLTGADPRDTDRQQPQHRNNRNNRNTATTATTATTKTKRSNETMTTATSLDFQIYGAYDLGAAAARFEAAPSEITRKTLERICSNVLCDKAALNLTLRTIAEGLLIHAS